MPAVVTKVLRSRWFVACVHAGLWLLLYLAITQLGGKAPDFHDTEAAANPPQSPAPVAGLEHLFSPGIWPQSLIDTNRLNPFATPAPPPATTRKIEVTYQGFYQTGDDVKHAIFKLRQASLGASVVTGAATNLFLVEATMQAMAKTNLSAQTNSEAYLVAPVGTRIATNLFIAAATMQAMTLTNLSAQTNILPLNTKKEIVVPIP